ncbi:MAG: hypothetical protein PHT99_07580 [Methanoregula sp.]|nr:hypothetical protein [Methanoregula sp.]
MLLLLICSVSIIAVAAADPGNISMLITPGPNLNVTNYSLTDPGISRTSAVTPTPVTVFQAEVTAETLPGPRYMGFGPSVIGLSVDPRLLALCFAVVLVSLVIWFVSIRKRTGNEPDHGKKE